MKDKTLPEGPWEFNTEVAAVFEDMLERSIPDYEKMRLASCAIAAPALQDDEGRVLDLGCANGMALSRLDTYTCLLYTSPSPRDATLSRMPSSA